MKRKHFTNNYKQCLKFQQLFSVLEKIEMYMCLDASVLKLFVKVTNTTFKKKPHIS